ncbi:MAG: hypothetical protein ACNA8K_00415 [Cyclonatronaceae bacterium]
MPTHRTGRETEQDPIRFKNLISRAEDDLENSGFKEREREALIKPLKDLLDDTMLWQHMGDGFAVFRSPGTFNYYRLPVRFDEFQNTAARFHLKPLMPLLTGDGLFYILVMSQKLVRLLRGSRDSVHAVEVEDLPKNLADALNIDEYIQTMQFHTGTSMRQAGRSAVFHGHGAGEDDNTHDIKQYLRKIDDALCNYMGSRKIPVILAGVDYLLPLYRDISNYGSLFEEGLPGNHDIQRPEEIHKKAWSLLEPYFDQTRKQAVEKYHELKNNSMATAELPQVLKAAAGGRVSTLFVDLQDHLWGNYAPEAGAIYIDEKPGLESVDLLDTAAIHTIQKGGTVYAVESDELPDESPLAAVFRY